jgi:signal transduction histidine kinase
LHISEITGDTISQVTALTNIGSLHREMNNPDIALQYLEKAKVIQNQDPPGHIPCYEFGLIYLEQGKLDLALEYELRAMTHFHTAAYAPMECYALEAVAKIYLKKKDYAQAMDYANQCLKLATELGDKQIQGDAWTVTSDIYLELKRYKECETMALKAWNADSLSLKSGHHIAYNIAQSNLFVGNKEKAAVFLEKYNDILKLYNDKNFHETFAGIEIQYETEKKELRITALEKARTLYIWLSVAGGTLLLSLLLLFIFRNRLAVSKQKLAEQQIVLAGQQIKQLEQEKQIVATQSVLDGETEERKRVAGELHDSLGAMLSVVKLNLSDVEHLDNARELLDQSIRELRRIAHRMMPESLLRYGLKTSLEDFCLSVPNARFHYFGDDIRLDNRMEIVIYRCVHELVNNAIKYSEAESINVQLLVQAADRISLTVQDNGHGFDTETPAKGMGLKNLRDRIDAYNGILNIYSSPGKGTEVYVEISLKYIQS